MQQSHEYRERFGVEPICAVLSEHGVKIAPSTYYAHKAAPVSDAALEEAYLVNALVTLWQENWGVYGVRKMWHAARRAGIEVARDQVGRLMQVAGIHGVLPRPAPHRHHEARRGGGPSPGPGAPRLGRPDRAGPAVGG
ncbi:hypothetical protein GCM10009826_46680 [Humibacillus xanthopallidus]